MDATTPATPAAPPADEPVHHPSYIGVWFGLAFLTAIELGVAFLPWAKITIILILVGLAVWKALLVALYYMHLRYEPTRLRVLAMAPLPLALILVVAVIMEYR
ncbi:MAG TPA: cytochrome C oxidase subunit IV family protein [Gemmatimonadaceae bacterium]|nr:cytochrome C oxidase subunit IV family protein [Gemmatimonadaceae bacterium]